MPNLATLATSHLLVTAVTFASICLALPLI